MPTRVISPAGGNWNATTSWVGGVVPVAGDDVQGTASSGNLTINVNTPNIIFYNFATYTGTITLNAIMLLSGVSSNAQTTTFGAGMSFAGNYSETSAISINPQGTHNIRTNGVKLPYVLMNKGSGAQTLTLLDDFNATTLSVGMGNATIALSGTYSVFINHFYRNNSGGGGLGTISALNSITGPRLNFVGPTASYNALNSTSTAAAIALNTNINVGPTGTFSTFAPFALNTGSNILVYTWISGILSGTKQLYLFDASNSQTMTLDFAGAGTWSNIYYTDTNTTAADRVIQLNSNLFFDQLESNPRADLLTSATSRRALRTIGPGALRGGRILGVPYVSQIAGTVPSQFGAPTYSTPMLKLTPGPIHEFSEIAFRGYDFGPLETRNSNNQASKLAWIQSATAGVQAQIRFTGGTWSDTFSAKPSTFVQYTDINAAPDGSLSPKIFNYGGGQTNCNNIATASFGSGGGGSFTFVN